MKRLIVIKPEKRSIRNAWVVSPKKADGTVDTNHYCVQIKTPEGETFQRKASEWGAMGAIQDAIRKAGDDGRRQMHIYVTITPGERINEAPADGNGGYPDSCRDAADIIRAVRAMADLSTIYFDYGE